MTGVRAGLVMALAILATVLFVVLVAGHHARCTTSAHVTCYPTAGVR